MHEYSLAASLVESVIRSLDGKKVNKIIEVEIELGELCFITGPQMTDIFAMASTGTPVEGADLKITGKKGRVHCHGCSFEGDPEFHGEVEDHHHVHLHCPKCNGVAVEILEGKDVILKNIIADVD